MAHNREKKALYEVMSKAAWPKPRYDKALEPLHQEKTGEDKQTATRFSIPLHKRAANWLNRPRIVQFNAGRIEISMPYQLAIALLLGLVLLVLVVFRLGQITYRSSQKATGPAAKMPESVQKAAPLVTAERAVAGKVTAVVAPQKAAPAEEKTPVPPVIQKVEPVKPKGDNRIVIQSYQLRADLEPVKQYFAQFGIETEIIKISDWYYLVTKDKYENPAKPGTDGYLAKQKIIELGAKYKAPPGSEAFGSQPFRDAYGKKFDE
jgi:Na+-transporting methylmalonyl-CoA/oxaloacetate decarboxylase gamma subunit